MLLYHFVSSSSLQTVPVTFMSGSFDQLKDFRGWADCGMFFFGPSSFGGGGGPGTPSFEIGGGGGHTEKID